ncbi:conserved Plasmodium protein, unknown function [Plasmodium malariae]|uniref:Uncharacterized protein n=1 Tax=Plasmodium malariae TaxID=5858 RepID=A0A1D3TF50_PLAMA|nr:conserved Plasmodium protein, unknown function [Plasmodium malariae]SCP03572.1 conserved Plasmodium protein, unknown function [Plasmodium malariae]
MNAIKKQMKCSPYRSNFRRRTFYSSVVINSFDFKNNQQLLLTKVEVVKNKSQLINNCSNFLKNFENFSVICCSCNDPKNKVQLKKSLWFSSIGLEIKDFLDYCYKDNAELKKDKVKVFEEIVKLQCPVILRDKNTILVEGEIAPKKVVNSAKRIRHFFNISETCRSCYQKNKCKRFLQKYSGEPDFSDFTRLMTGYYNICKIYIKRKDEDREELIPIVEKVNHFHFVLFHMYNYLLKHKHFNYSNVEEGSRTAILKYLKEKRKNTLLIKNQFIQEKLLNIPKEYSDIMIPTAKAKMKKRQKNIFERVQKFKKKSKISEAEEEKFIWVEETGEEGAFHQNDNNIHNSDNPCANEMDEGTDVLNDTYDDMHNTLTEIKSSCENSPMLRFHYISKKGEDNSYDTILNYNSLYNKYTELLEKRVYVNLDDQEINEDIIKNLELLKGRQVKTNDSKHNCEQDEEITELTDVIKRSLKDSFEYIYNRSEAEKIDKKINRRSRINSLMKLESPSSSYGQHGQENDDSEDARFEYFKQLRDRSPNFDEHVEIKEEFNSIYNDTYHAHKGVTLEDIEEERKNLIERDKKELKEHSFYICKNAKFPELQNGENTKTLNRNKYLNDELQEYMRPQSSVHKNNLKIKELKEETIQAHSSSTKG